MRSWMGGRTRLLAAEKVDRTSVQKRFFEQQRGHPGAAAALPSSLGTAGASVGTRGHGTTRATSGAAEAHSSRKDVLASLDLLALSSDGSKRGRAALRSGARRPPGGGPTAEHSATLPGYHRRRLEAHVDTLPSDGEPVAARPPGMLSEERRVGKRPMDVIVPGVSDRAVRQRTEASDPPVPGPDTSPSFETQGGQSLRNRSQPQQLSSGGVMSSLDGTRPFSNVAELGRRYLKSHTPSSSTAVLDYRRGAPLSSQPSQADNWLLPVQSSLAAHLPRPLASSPKPSAAAGSAHGAPLSHCFSSRPGRGSVLASTTLAADFDIPVSHDADASGFSRDGTPGAEGRRERDAALSTSRERGQLGQLDGGYAASAGGSDSLRVAPRYSRLRHPELDAAGGLECFPVSPSTRLPSSSRRLSSAQGHRSEQPRTPSANPVHIAHANHELGRFAGDGLFTDGVCSRPSPCDSERGRDASGAAGGHRDEDALGGDKSPVARTLSSNPSTGSSSSGVYPVKQGGLRAGPISPSALSAELGALERKILGDADEDTGPAFQVPPRMSSGASSVRRLTQSRAGGVRCPGGAGPEDGSSGRPSSSSGRGASTSSRSVSNPLASTSCPLDASLAEAL